MPYDHSNKIGNQGDLVKHIALFAALRSLLASHRPGVEFAYADIHTGRPQYVLPEKGEWNHGVGVFSRQTEVVADRKERKAGRPSRLEAAGAFDEALVGRQLTTGMLYPGSSGLAFRTLREWGGLFGMRLWEKDRAAADDLLRYFHPWQEQVSVTCGNGYEVRGQDSKLSFVLIDPPELETDPVLETLRWLKERGVPFLCWMPRTSRAPEEKGGNAREAETSLAFASQARKVGQWFGVRWYEWGHRTPGCSLTTSTDLAPDVAASLRVVTRLLGWDLAVLC